VWGARNADRVGGWRGLGGAVRARRAPFLGGPWCLQAGTWVTF